MKERTKISNGAGRSHRGGAVLAAFMAFIVSFGFGPRCAAQAGLSASSAAFQDTAATSSADTSAAPERKAVWTMDELKNVLGNETKGFGKGKEYEERKNGRVAMACALLFPGLGQMYNEKPFKAAIAAGVEVFYMNQIAINRRLREREKDVRDGYPVSSSQWALHDGMVKEYWDRSVDWIWWSSAVVLVVMIDAYVDAHLDDMRFRVEVRRMEEGAGVGLVFRY